MGRSDLTQHQLRFDARVIEGAFMQHREGYADRQANPWDVKHHVGLWTAARTAFEQKSPADFRKVYDGLRNYWQAFRGGDSHLSVDECFEALKALDSKFATQTLSTLEMDAAPDLWRLLESANGIKKNRRSGPSVVAISKFLHFWNPRLFVILDFGIMWKMVLRPHWWLWTPFCQFRETLGCKKRRDDDVCDLLSYMAFMLWTAEIARANPEILPEYRKYMRGYADKVEIPPEVYEYEAAAVEWFLLGVVEMPPWDMKAAN